MLRTNLDPLRKPSAVYLKIWKQVRETTEIDPQIAQRLLEGMRPAHLFGQCPHVHALGTQDRHHLHHAWILTTAMEVRAATLLHRRNVHVGYPVQNGLYENHTLLYTLYANKPFKRIIFSVFPDPSYVYYIGP